MAINKSDRTLRIAMLGHKLVPSRDGGVEVVVGELSTRMAALGHKVTVYNRVGHQQRVEIRNKTILKEYKGVRLVWVPTLGKAGIAAFSSSVTAAIPAAFGRYDIAHFHAEGPSAMCWLPRLMGKKVIVTVHGLDHQRQKWGRFASFYIKMGERMAVHFANEIIVLSKGVQQYFKEKYGRDTVLIYNGVTPGKPVPPGETLERFGLEAGKYILFLGRLVPEKGIHYLIEAYKGLQTDCKLVIAGGSSDTDHYVHQLQAQAADDPRIVFTGFVQGKALEELYSNSYIYVLPSDLEGMPIGLLEAMSFGCCCLTSDITECTDVTADSGVAFKKGDVNSLREKLQELCDHPDVAAGFRARAVKRVNEHFHWDGPVKSTLQLYEKVLK